MNLHSFYMGFYMRYRESLSLIILVLLTSLFFMILVGCDIGLESSGGNISSQAMLGLEKAYPPEWELGDYWVVKRVDEIAGKVDVKYYVYAVENKTHLNATVPLVPKEGDLNFRSVYLRQPQSFAELVSSEPEGDYRIDEDVYVLGKYQPQKLEPIYDTYADCYEPTHYRLNFGGETLKKELVYSQKDLRLLWDADSPGRQLKMFHWPLRTGKYWSFPIVDVESNEGEEYIRQKIIEGRELGNDFKEHQAFGKAAVVEYDEGKFMIEMYGLYPFYANYDKKDQVFWYDVEKRFWEWNTYSDLAGIRLNFTETIELAGYGKNLTKDDFGNPIFFGELTDVVDFRVENQNYESLCASR